MNLWPKGHEFHNLGRGARGHHNHAFSKEDLLRFKTFSGYGYRALGP